MRRDPLDEIRNAKSLGRPTGRNLATWARRATEHSQQHGVGPATETQSPERDLDLPRVPGSAPVKNFDTSKPSRGRK